MSIANEACMLKGNLCELDFANSMEIGHIITQRTKFVVFVLLSWVI